MMQQTTTERKEATSTSSLAYKMTSFGGRRGHTKGKSGLACICARNLVQNNTWTAAEHEELGKFSLCSSLSCDDYNDKHMADISVMLVNVT